MLIGEVSKKYNIGVETLRYYDKIGLLTVERKNYNRYYTEKDIIKLQNIMAMKEMMFSLKDIKRILEIAMKNIPYEDNSFHAVICTSALDHGTFKEIKMIINEIYRVLKPDGILIADLLSVEDESFGMGEKIETNTFIGGRKGEDGIPHHYADKNEIIELFKSFKEVRVYRRNYIFDLVHEEIISQVYDIECIK